MPDSDEHENDIYEDEEIELSDDDPPAPMVGSFISVYIFRYFSFVFSILEFITTPGFDYKQSHQ